MNQALTNVLLMDAVVGSLQTQKSITAASKLAYFDQKHEGDSDIDMEYVHFYIINSILFCLYLVPMMVSKVTSDTLKHKINPSQELPEPQTVHVLLYTPGTFQSKGFFVVVLIYCLKY